MSGPDSQTRLSVSMTLTCVESASFAGSVDAMEPKARVNSLSSLAMAAYDSAKPRTTGDDSEPKPTATTSLTSGTSRASVTNGSGTTVSSPEQKSGQPTTGTHGTPVQINIHKAPQSIHSSTSSMVSVMPPQGANRRRASSNTGLGRRKSWDQRFAGPIRRASQVIISLTNPGIDGSFYGECSRRDSRIVPEIMLMHSCFQRLPMKDFGAEVRASMDVDQFLQQAVLLLDVTETSLEGIVDKMLRKVSNHSLIFSYYHIISAHPFFQAPAHCHFTLYLA